MTREQELKRKMAEQKQVMTFYVEDKLFGLDVADILLLGQDINAIETLPFDEAGVAGMIKLQKIAIPVIDFAARIGLRSGTDEKNALLTQFETVQQGYQDWCQELQWKLTAHQSLTNKELWQNANLLNWHHQIQIRDVTLQTLLSLIDEPKTAFKHCLEQLITLTAEQQWQQADILFNQQKAVILEQIEQRLDRARKHLKTMVRHVLLYLTTDGKTPSYALLVDQINDVLSYPMMGFQSCETGPMSVIQTIKHAVDGIYINDGMPNCFYVSVNELLDSQQQLATA